MVIKDGGVVPICCGDPMQELKANSVDAAGEKHVPIIEKTSDQITVKVGSVPHPMSPEHHIEWIVLLSGDEILTTKLKPETSPQATFNPTNPGNDITAYAYCNLHGLWVSE